MLIRPMTTTDVLTVAQIDGLSFSTPWPEGSFGRELNNPSARCWVAELDGNVAGTLVIWRVLDEAHIATIAIHPAYRRRGTGKALLKAGMEAAYAEGARIFHLEVRVGNAAAIKMYAGLGYEVVGRRPHYYQSDGEDALLMTKTENTEAR